MKKKSTTMQLNFRVKPELLEEAKRHVNEVQFRSIGQILNIALTEWLARQHGCYFPSPYAALMKKIKQDADN